MRTRYDEDFVLKLADRVLGASSPETRTAIVGVLDDVDDDQADVLLERLLQDREPSVRVAAAESLAFRAEILPGSRARSILESCLQAGRRELVLPSAEGLARGGKREAFQPLMLVYKAGEPAEQARAVRAMGDLADKRVMEELERLAAPGAELEEFEVPLVPAALEALAAMAPRMEDDRERLGELLLKILNEGDYPQQLGVLIGLRRAGDEAGRTLLEKLATDKSQDQQLRMASIQQLQVLASADSAPSLAEVLQEQDWTLANQAIQALGACLPDDPTQVALYRLHSPHSSLAAAQHLAEHGEAGALVSSFDRLKNTEVRRALSRGLIRRKLFPSDELRAVLGGSSDPARTEAALMVGASKERGVFDDHLRAAAKDTAARLASYRRDSSPEADDASEALTAILWAALRLEVEVVAIGREVLERGAESEGLTNLCLSVLAAQGKAGDVPLATKFLTHESLAVRQSAGAACATLAKGGVSERLEDVVRSQAASREVLKQALGDSKARVELLKDQRLRTLALPAVLGEGQVDDLLSLSRSGDEKTRLVAIGALGRRGGKEAEEVLTALLQQEREDAKIRQAAFKALRRLQRRAERTARYEAS